MDPQNITEEDLKKMTPEEMREFQKKQCIFCHIIAGKIPSKKVYEDDRIIAILDINPATPGHVLVMPKEHYMIMPQMNDDDIKHIYVTAKVISQAQLRGLSVEGTNVFIANGYVAGQKAQHFMLHVIPRLQNDGLDFNLTESTMPRETLEKYRIALGKRLSDLMGVEFKRDTQRTAVVQQKIEPSITKTDKNEEDIQEEQEIEGEIEEVEAEKSQANGTDLDRIASLFTGRSAASLIVENESSEDIEEKDEDKKDKEETDEKDDRNEEERYKDEKDENERDKNAENKKHETKKHDPVQQVSHKTSNKYVASTKSTKFHTLNCPFVKRIPLENRTYFDSKIEAEEKHERCNCVD